MSRNIARQQTPEERELAKKLEELSSLQIRLVQQELDLATLQAELNAFERRYLRIIGIRYAELDEIEAKIAETLSRVSLKNHQAQERAYQTRVRADELAHTSKIVKEPTIRGDKFKPSEALKKLYREVAKCIHPDLATDENDRIRRERFMAEVNQAYEAGDEKRLREILHEWESSPEAIRGDGVGAELIRVIRKISQVEGRLLTIETAITQLQSSALFQLQTEVEEAEVERRDLLAEMASRLDQQMGEAKAHLASLIQEISNHVC